MDLRDKVNGHPVDVRVRPQIVPGDGFNNREAFALMKYAEQYDPNSNNVPRVEWLWNSRDGVTPFIIKNGNVLMQHVDWHEDLFVPNFVPPVGMRVFEDMAGYDPATHDFNLAVSVVTQEMHDHFAKRAYLNPWKPRPVSRIIQPNGGRYA